MMNGLFSGSVGLPDNLRTALTVGTFDGVHVGHARILDELSRAAARAGLRSLVVTFEPHPRHVVQPDEAFGLLTSTEKKLRLIAELGLDYVAVLRFDRKLAGVAPERFVLDYLLGKFRMGTLVVGYDHGFGSRRSGSEKLLTRLAGEYNFSLIKVPPVILDGRPVSSSRVRRAIEEGNLDLAGRLLGRYYSFTGKVVPGTGRGKTIGRPTANLRLFSGDKQLFPDGVYAALADLDGKLCRGVLHHGPRPTFDDMSRSLELNLYDFSGDLYGKTLEVFVVEFVRPVARFAGAGQLARQMKQDDQQVRKVLESAKIPSASFLSRVG